MRAIKVIVEAVDRVTAPLRRIGAAIRRIDLGPLRDQLRAVVSAAKGVGSEIGRMAKNVGVGIAAIAVGAGVMLGRVVESSNAARLGAERVGISMKAYQAYGYAAQKAGSNVDEMADAIKELNAKIVEAAGGNKDLASAFQNMGVSLKDANGQLRPTEDILADVADAFSRVPDGAKKSAAAMALMGDAGIRMIPMLNKGAEGLRKAAEEAERLGLVIDEKTAAGFAALSADMIRLQGASTGLQNAIAARLLPTIAPLVSSLTDWIVANRELIATGIGEWIDRLPAIVQGASDAVRDWSEALAPLASAIGIVVEWMGPWNAGIALAASLIGGKLLLTLWPLIKAFTLLGKVVGKLAFGPVIAMAGQLFTALRAGTGVMAAFNLVLAANPIGATVLAVTALAGAAFLIYRNWDRVAPWFAALWDRVKQAFNGIVDFVAGVFTGDFGRALDGLKNIGAGILEYFKTFWRPVLDAFRSFLGWIDGTFGTNLLGAFNRLVETVKGAISNRFVSLWEPVKTSFSGFVEFVSGIFSGDFGRALDGLKGIGSGIVGYFEAMWSPVEDAFQTFLGWIDGTFGTNLSGAFESLKSAATGVASWFETEFGNLLKAGLDAAYAVVKPVIDTISAAIAGIITGINSAISAAENFSKISIAPAVGAAAGGAGVASGGAGASAGRPDVWNRLRPPGPVTEGVPVPPDVPPATLGRGPAQRVDVGGQMNLHVSSDGRASVTDVRMNNPAITTDVSSGPSNAMP